ncbi:zinc ribbon domain-containing protein [Nitrosarchaeum sp. AC2]|uniref:zinc ribbon domain-containing protein n=1 Tax=Nitrosarchaeum sp. AC2 TaxID=2259673 RepID=UPI0015CCE483|nr:zinc ribbon domain-containing protein [Nitrosarchaeum sp. AC2]QLH11475.1 hypothetical protein DSQ20_08505 [Nitrosarchaeum sp. AC2]
MPFCPKCGNEIPIEGNFCNKCGFSISDISKNEKNNFNSSDDKPKKKGRSKTKKIGIGLGIVVLVFFGLVILAAIGSDSTDSIEVKKTNQPLSPTQIKNSAILGIDYDELLRHNEKYVDKIVYLEGKVVQSQRVYGDNYALLVSITKEDLGFGTTFYTDSIWLNYEGPRVLEDDIVGIYGKVTGIKEYTAVLGNIISVPEVNSLLLEVIDKDN